MRKNQMMQRIQIPLLALALVCVTSFAWACSVPVFRYALERWRSDPYEVILYYKGKLNEPQKKLVRDLTEEGTAGKQHANVRLTLVNLETAKDSDDSNLVELWKKQKSETLPWMTVKYPKVARNLKPAWSGALTTKNVDRLLDSPVRREVARRILKGETATWVFLEIGDKAKDDAAFQILQAELSRAEKDLEMPKISEEDKASGLVSADQEELKLQFSVIRLSRSNLSEKMLIEMLLGSEDGLRELKEPMAFPVFGRGRVLYGLVGKGMNKDTIHTACQELIGPCTCEVKDENPGVDLIMSVDWEKLVESTVEIDRELPPLPGFGGIVNADDQKKQTAELVTAKQSPSIDVNAKSESDSKSSSPVSPMLRMVLVTGGVGVLVLFGFYFLVRKEV